MSEAINTHNLKVTFGRHDGELWTRVPVGYLNWMVNHKTMSRDKRDIAQAELDRRGTTMPTIDISGHAIDSASLRVRRTWHENKNDNEGLHSWMQRMCTEALKSVDGEELEEIEYSGVVWIFEYGNYYPSLKTVKPVKRKKEKCNQSAKHIPSASENSAGQSRSEL